MSLLARLPLTPQQQGVLSDAEFQQLRQLISKKTGIYFSGQQALSAGKPGRTPNE